jgi:SAM-dependent methyltransferase
MTSLLKAMLRPVRRAAATFVLVDEERSLRIQDTAGLVDPVRERVLALEREAERFRHDVAVVKAQSAEVLARVARVEEQVVRRVELVVSEVMHRAEASDARLATDLQRALEVLARQQRDVAALTRSVSGPLPLGDLQVTPAVTASPYRMFGELERGTREQVAARLGQYVPLFDGLGPVVDLGCGRGEFLELATEVGLDVYGVDSDPEAVAACRLLGLKVEDEDALEHLARLEDASVGGLMCTHMLEHLPADGLWPFFEQLQRVLAPGGLAVVETPNPSTLVTHLASFWRDPTHVRPVPAPAVWFAARRAGLVVADTLYGHLPEQRFERSGLAAATNVEVRGLAQSYDAVVERLNDLLLGPQDYAVVLRKP